MRSDDDLLGPLRVLYLVHALPPIERTGTSLIAFEYAKRAGARGWKTAVVSANPAVTGWRDVREWRDQGEWFTRFAVPLTPPAPATTTRSDPKSPPSRFFAGLLRRLAPDVVHVVDNDQLPEHWPDMAAAAGIPVVRFARPVDDELVEVSALYKAAIGAQSRPPRWWRRARPLMSRG
jgi:hypothetical protein